MRKVGLNMATVFFGAAVVTSLIAGTNTASADDGPVIIMGSGQEACPPDKVCLYENLDYNVGREARILVVKKDIADLRQIDFNDVASSYCNNTRWSVGFGREIDNGELGPGIRVDPHTCGREMPEFIGNDSLSSVEFKEW